MSNDLITIVIQIGNSDDKLTQKEWSEFCNQTRWEIERFAKTIHFSGFSLPSDPWQNACFVFELKDDVLKHLSINLKTIRQKYGQDSIALTEGSTIFI